MLVILYLIVIVQGVLAGGLAGHSGQVVCVAHWPSIVQLVGIVAEVLVNSALDPSFSPMRHKVFESFASPAAFGALKAHADINPTNKTIKDGMRRIIKMTVFLKLVKSKNCY